jgi:YD repeat-containing protein
LYEGGGVNGLSLVLNHTSRQSSDSYSPSGVVGLNWVTDLDSKLLLAADGTTTTGPSAVYVQRPNGQTLTYTRSGTNYTPDADVAHKLLRQTDSNGGTTGWRLIDAVAQTTETYDAGGTLTSLTDRNGLTRTLAYDTNNRVITLTDAQGRQLTLGYDGSNRINAVTQPDSGIIHLAYDASNNLSGITWPDGKVRTYHYESASFPHNLTGITDENGVRYATYSYDSQGRATSETLAGGADATSLVFGSNSTTVTDARSTARTYTFQTILGVTKSLGSNQPGGSGCSAAASALSYDANGNIASRTDFNGYKTTYTYDLSRNLETQRKEGLNGDRKSVV